MKKNYNYGKIVDGKLEYAPNMLIIVAHDEEGHEYERQIFNAHAETYLEQGWKTVVKDDYPQDGKTYEMDFVVTDDTIYIHWQEIEPPVPVPSIDDRVEAIESAIVEIADELWG